MQKSVKIIVLPLFYLCNAQCSMCNIWKNKNSPRWEINELRNILNQPELSNSVEVVNITGGEPTLHRNLPNYIRLVSEVLTKINTISIQTHGLQPNLLSKHLVPISTFLAEMNSIGKSIHLDVNISLDGPQGIHDRVRGVTGAFNSVVESVRRVKECSLIHKKLATLFNCTIVSDNVDHLFATQEIADKLGIEITYTLPQDTDVYMSNSTTPDKYRLNDAQRRIAAAFLRSIVHRTTGSSGMSKRYCEMLIELLETNKRNIGCPLADGGLFMSPDGSAMPCWRSSKLHLGNLRKASLADIMKSRESDDYQDKLKALCAECPSNCYVDWNRRMFSKRISSKEESI